MTHQATFQEARHAHRWRIDEPNGANESRGECRCCGAVRMFKNWFDEDPKSTWTRKTRKEATG